MPNPKRAYVLILPSAFTTGNLFCGFYAIIRAFNYDFDRACYAILLAGLFDVLDGRVARITRSQSEFGVEYDSIADVISFGVAPAVLSYVWSMQSLGRIGFAAAFFFAACGALRLARFNTLAASDAPRSYFLGLPIPAAANLVATFVLASTAGEFALPKAVMVGLLFVAGALMVSNVRYRSFKDFDLRHRRSFLWLVLIVATIAFVVVRPELGLFALFAYYTLSGPVREGVAAIALQRGRRLDAELVGKEPNTSER